LSRPEFRATFERGEISPDWLRRVDTEGLTKSLKTGTNLILKNSGGALRRPGSNEIAILNGSGREYVFNGRDAVEHLVLSNGRLDVYSEAGALLQTITSGIAWATAQLSSLHIKSDANKVFVFHTAFVTQVLSRDEAGTWSRADFAFTGSIGSNLAQPFYDKFDPLDVTMSLNAYSGTLKTMTFSSAVLETDGSHVGVRFRYLTRCEVEITAVASATSATVTIHDALYPTVTVTVGDSSGYKVGHVVEGSISQVRGLVSSIPGGTTVNVTLLEGYERYQVITTAGVDKDRLVGPEAQQEITGVSTVATPATTSIWDEQLISPARGYPATGLVHRGRLFMAGFPQATNVITASSVGNFYNFKVGAETDAALNVELGDEPNSTVRHLVSAEQLLLFSDRGGYYVPESAESPISPDNIVFLRFASEGAGTATPIIASEGALFIDNDAGRLLAAVPTGNVRRSWQVVELSEQSYHLLTGPIRLAVANGLDGRTERYVFVLNSDGTMAVMIYRRNTENVGFVGWVRGTGTWTDVFAVQDDLYAVSLVGSTYRLCKFSFTALTDDEVDYSGSVTGWDGVEVELVNTLCVVTTDTVASGVIPAEAAGAGLTLGLDFTVTLQPASPIDPAQGYRRKRIARTTIEVLDTGAFMVNGQRNWPFLSGSDLDNVGATLTRAARAHRLGWANDQVDTFSQPKGEGALFDALAVTMEIV